VPIAKPSLTMLYLTISLKLWLRLTRCFLFLATLLFCPLWRIMIWWWLRICFEWDQFSFNLCQFLFKFVEGIGCLSCLKALQLCIEVLLQLLSFPHLIIIAKRCQGLLLRLFLILFSFSLPLHIGWYNLYLNGAKTSFQSRLSRRLIRQQSENSLILGGLQPTHVWRLVLAHLPRYHPAHAIRFC
jgi:hypothetical protein